MCENCGPRIWREDSDDIESNFWSNATSHRHTRRNSLLLFMYNEISKLNEHEHMLTFAQLITLRDANLIVHSYHHIIDHSLCCIHLICVATAALLLWLLLLHSYCCYWWWMFINKIEHNLVESCDHAVGDIQYKCHVLISVYWTCTGHSTHRHTHPNPYVHAKQHGLCDRDR